MQAYLRETMKWATARWNCIHANNKRRPLRRSKYWARVMHKRRAKANALFEKVKLDEMPAFKQWLKENRGKNL